MKKYLALAMFVVLAVILASPFSVSAETKAGTKSGSFFYFFDTAFEKADLFFTFNPEKKAKKALENAEERLAEAEESASENKPEAVTEAMENYKKNIEVLEKVLIKVPEEAKEAIEKAIEASKERQEETMKETTELEKEVSEIKPEIEETENELKEEENEEKAEIKDDKKDEQKKEIEKLKKEVEGLKQKTSQIKIIEKAEKIIEKPTIIEKKESSSSQTKQKEVTLPNGAVVEMDENGNVVRTIKEAVQQIQTSSLNSNNSKFITIKELDGSYQQKNRNAELFFSIYNNSDIEAHINSVSMQLFGYGFLPNTEAIAYFQGNATSLEHYSKSATSSIVIKLTLNSNQPLIIYEKSHKNFRVTITFDTMAGSEINAATLLGVGFSGVSANNFIAQGLPITIYTKKVEVGYAPEDF